MELALCVGIFLLFRREIGRCFSFFVRMLLLWCVLWGGEDLLPVVEDLLPVVGDLVQGFTIFFHQHFLQAVHGLGGLFYHPFFQSIEEII